MKKYSEETLREILKKIEKQQQIILNNSSLPFIDREEVEKLSAIITEVTSQVAESEVTGRQIFNESKEALKKSEERFSRIAATIPGILYDYILYPDGRSKFLYISPRCYDILELKQEELIDDIYLLEKLIHREDICRMREENEKAVREGIKFNIEVRIITPSGKLKWLHMSSLPNTPPPGEPVVWSGFIMDITDRKTAEEALKKKTEEVEKFFNSALDLLCIADTDGYFHRLNPEWEHTLGYSVKELEGKKFLDFVHPDDLKDTIGAITTLRENKEVLNFMNRYRAKNGSYKWIEWRSYPAGKFIYAAARDITLRIKTEEALRESEAKYRRIIDTSYDGICILNSDFIITSVNNRMAEMLDYNIDEVTGKSLDDFVFAEDLHEHYEKLEKRRQGFSEQYERRFRKKDGSPVWTIVSATPMYNPAGHFSGSFAMFTDITKRKQIEEALRESQSRLEEAQKIAHVGYWEHDLITDSIICSGETYRIFGIEQHGKHITMSLLTEHIHPEDRESVNQVFSETLSDKKRFDLEHRTLHHDGTTRYVHNQGDIIHDREGRVVRIFGTVLDITEIKMLHEEKLDMERRLLQAQKMESLAIMAGGIAHDFNNILMIMLTNLELALMDIPGDSPAVLSVEGAMKAGKRASELTGKMLAYCGKGRFLVNKINLNKIIEEHVKRFGKSLTKSSEIKMDFNSALPFIEGDTGQIQQIIIALITNASEAMEDRKGLITISTGIKECDPSYLSKSRLEILPEPGLFVYMEVRDTGIGMDEETQKKIFDPFFTTKFTGRGLGMSAVIGIIRSHGGAIFVESAKNIGTAVTVMFPAYKKETPEICRETSDKKVTPLLNRTVLLVDDEDMLRKSGKAILTRFGFNVITASDGLEAVEIYKKHSSDINCIIMDLSMPRMDGITALKKIRHLNPEIKIILSSGYNEQEAIGHYTGHGISGFLQKPYEIRKLKEKLKDI
ncbi:MAG: PAS domain S-box protein [Candidatus Eremiobacterota bacterium]